MRLCVLCVLCGESNSKLNYMKVRTILFAALSLAALNANAQRIKGSDTVLPVAQQTAERFMNRDLMLVSPSPEVVQEWVSPPCWIIPLTSPWPHAPLSSAKR